MPLGPRPHPLRALAPLALLAALAACSEHLPDTALFRGVDDLEPAAGERLISSRLEALFAVGRPEAGLDRYLRAQGMSVRRQSNAGPGLPVYGEASARGVGQPCPRVAMVIWRADAAGVIRDLSVLYKQAACV